MSKAYYHHMDSLRAVMMVLGVVLHAAQVFDPRADWLMMNPETHPLYAYLIESIHNFRMPVFFMVSGFFTLFVLLRKNSRYFIESKLRRIGIPILTTALTLNLLQSVFLDHWNDRAFSLQDYLLVGWVGHLWFLVDLLIYFIIIYLLSPLFFRYHGHMKQAIDAIASPLPALAIVLLLPLSKIGVLALNTVGFPLYWSFGEIISVSSLADYFPFFLFGIAMYLSPLLADKIQAISLMVLGITIAVVYVLLHSSMLDNRTGMVFAIAKQYLDALQTWSMAFFVYVYFYRFFSGQSRIFRMVSESSYTVYLVHHSLIIFLGAALAQIRLNVHAKFLLLFLSTYVISYCFHQYVVARVNLMSFLFNGRALKESA